MEPSILLGNLIRDKMEYNRISLVMLARHLGVAVGTIHNWRAGKVGISFENFVKLSKALDFTIEDIRSLETAPVDKLTLR